MMMFCFFLVSNNSTQELLYASSRWCSCPWWKYNCHW